VPANAAGARVVARSGGTVETQATFTPTLPLSGYNALAFQHLTIDSISNAGQILGVAYWTGTTYQFGNLTTAEVNALGTTRGYWLFAGSPTTFAYSGNDLSGNRSAQLGFGWNMVAFPAQQDVQANTLQAFRSGAPVNMTSVISTDFFEVGTNNQLSLTNVLSPGAVLRAGRPYWVYAAEAVTLTYSVPVPTPTPTPSVIPPPLPSPSPGPSVSPTPVPSPSPTPAPSPSPTPVAAHGRLYVGVVFTNRIAVFDQVSGLNGDAPFSRLLQGPALTQPEGLSLDIPRDTLYVSQGNTVLAFSPASSVNGNVAPARTLTLGPPSVKATSVQIDSVHDRLYVGHQATSNTFALLVFDNASTKSGVFNADRQITGFPDFIRGMALDVGADRLFLASHRPDAIYVFDNISTKNGTMAALVNRTVTAAPNTQLLGPQGLCLDVARQKLYVTCILGNTLQAYANAATMNGPTAPVQTLFGSTAGLNFPGGVQVDFGSNELYVANFNNGPGGDIRIWSNADTVTGDVAPTRRLFGPNTGFESPGTPGDIVLDPR